MSVVAEVERQLALARCRQLEDATPELRASTMTHIVWAPPEWLSRVHKVLAGLEERHPARTILLVPRPRGAAKVTAKVDVRDFDVSDGHEVLSEVIELRLHGASARHPGSLVQPLLISDLPAFCRWRGEPPWGSVALAELVSACDRLVVDSSEWPAPTRRYGRLAGLFDEIAISDLAWRRGLPWRAALASLWPGIRRAEHLLVEGPQADAELLAGWLQSRLRRPIRLTRRRADTIAAVSVDGEPVKRPPGPRPTGSELLSAELDTVSRDAVYEAAVLAVSAQRRATRGGGGRSTRSRSPRRSAPRRRSP
jgi:glucose-6-phosphate dehydrogenase assembly protein OpcA